jgi:hypothetical protein
MKIPGFTIEARSSTKNPADGIFGNDRHCATRISTDVAVSDPPSHFINGPAHWRQRAQETRALANQIADGDAKLAMLRIADEYELLAKWAAARALGRAPNSN